MSTIINYLSVKCRNQRWALTSLMIILSILSIPQTAPLMSRVRNTSYDFYQRLQPRTYQTAPVKIISIDNKSLEKIGQFPWSRVKMAQLIEKLNALGAKVIAFDMVFSEPDRTSPKHLSPLFANNPLLQQQLMALPDNDEVLAAAMAKANVVGSFMLTAQPNDNDFPKAKAGILLQNSPPFAQMNCLYPSGRNLAIIEQSTQGNGTIAYIADEDGVIRNVPLLFCLQHANQYRLFPTLSLEAVRLFKQQGQYNISTDNTGELTEIKLGKEFNIELNEDTNVWLHYTPSMASRYIPAWKVLEDKLDKHSLQGSIVFVGVTASNLFDMRFNPFGHIIPGVEVHAQLTEQLLQGSYLHKLSLENTWLTLLLILSFYLFCKLQQKISATKLALILLTFIILILSLCWAAFIYKRLLIDPLLPSFALIFLFIAFFIQKQLKTEDEKRWLRSAFERYISPNRVKHLIEHPDSLSLGGEYRECSFVMTDLANFTSLMEKHSPHECVSMLNEYLDGMIQIAFKYNGTLDRIVGDAVAVIFSAPLVQENHRELALQCSLDMDAYAMQFVSTKDSQGIKFGITRIGVCTGDVLVGNFGGKTMFDYRALGDPINTASRLESVNKQFGTRLCVAESTLEGCENFKTRPIGDLVLKGKTEPIKAFELLSEEQFKQPLIQTYLDAYQIMARSGSNALGLFKQLIEQYPEDSLSLYHYQRLEDKLVNNLDINTTIILKDK